MAPKMFEVSFKENYAILSMKCGENRLNPKFLEDFHCALDKIERNKDVQFLITTGDGKFYSNGIDLEFLGTCTAEEKLKTINAFPLAILRLLTFPVPTIAALNGHAFAGGGILALAHDYRVMRTKRGWFCLPEVDLHLQFGKANLLLLRAKIKDPKILSDAVLMGKRFVAEEALSGGIIQKVCSAEQLLDTAVQMGKEAVEEKKFKRDFFKEFKTNLYSDIVDAFQRQISNTEESLKVISDFSLSSKL
ncbi:unnamed protein product [Porites lobata]|uniref:Uncharacterized protein n=1 Tax=Porites lobata TaxID=104759 RepID=A0ABN8P9C2_9CNID|nr:unnamed protein product [Porites lobata]